MLIFNILDLSHNFDVQIYDRLKENVLGMWTILRKDRHYNVIAILMSESV